MILCIDRAARIGLAIQMNRQTGNHGYGLLEVHQRLFQLLVGIAIYQTASNREIAIKPGVEQSAPIDFYAQLKVARLGDFWLRLDHKTGAVGMSSCQPDARRGKSLGAHHKGNNRGPIAGDIMFVSSF